MSQKSVVKKGCQTAQFALPVVLGGRLHHSRYSNGRVAGAPFKANGEQLVQTLEECFKCACPKNTGRSKVAI